MITGTIDVLDILTPMKRFCLDSKLVFPIRKSKNPEWSQESHFISPGKNELMRLNLLLKSNPPVGKHSRSADNTDPYMQLLHGGDNRLS